MIANKVPVPDPTVEFGNFIPDDVARNGISAYSANINGNWLISGFRTIPRRFSSVPDHTLKNGNKTRGSQVPTYPPKNGNPYSSLVCATGLKSPLA